MSSSHSESTQLSSSTLSPDSRNLRKLARDSQATGTGLQIAELLHVDDLAIQQSICGRTKLCDKKCSRSALPAVIQNQSRNDDILNEDEARLSVCAEWEALAIIVCERDEVGSGFKEVGEERDAFCRARVNELEDLRDLNDGRSADYANPKTFGNGKFDAFGGCDVDCEGFGQFCFSQACLGRMKQGLVMKIYFLAEKAVASELPRQS